jgi:TalC/MipB family fructose-6-phosphate aldolase
MRLYLDTADRASAEDWLGTGLFEGVTTNPTILQRSGLGVSAAPDIHAWATEAGAKQVFFQAWGLSVSELVERGHELRMLGPEVVVKLVASRAGASACAQLSRDGVPTLLTAVYAPAQALVAAAAGADFIAPYLGKLDDAGRDGVRDVIAMQDVLRGSGSDTEILLASIRNVSSMVKLARHGIRCFTMNPAVAQGLFADELTAAAVVVFEDAVESTS